MDAIYAETVGFNPAPPTILLLDLNSCFATIEQQANPLLRGKPVVVAAYTSPNGCILAASVEAKRFGVKTGMRVRDGKALHPELIVLPSDPEKYRFVNHKLLTLLSSYTSDVEVKSIDEMILPLAGSPALWRRRGQDILGVMLKIGQEIKERIKTEIGEWLKVSVGISTNRFLAKTAASLDKPDGLRSITRENIEAVLAKLELEDLCGIKTGNGSRLRRIGITTALEFYRATIAQLKLAFHSVVGYHWWLRLHGWEADDRDFSRKSIGHSYALYKPYLPSNERLQQILCQLVEKMGKRLREHKLTTQGVNVSCLFTDYTSWRHSQTLPRSLYASRDLFAAAKSVLLQAPSRPVRILAVSCFKLNSQAAEQMKLFTNETKKKALTAALDKLSDRWGDFVVMPGRMLALEQKILDRIAFGGVKDLPTDYLV